jgi:uncharacterized lipoprotein NlpE involved in copper resistance
MSGRGNIVPALILGLALVGCDSQPEAKSVAFYMAHPVEREELMAACKPTREASNDDADCANAGKAWLASWGVRPAHSNAAGAPK